MPEQKTSFEYNMQSGIYREKLDQPARDQMDAMQKVRDTDLRSHDADYQRHQQQRIAEQEAHLTKHHELNISAPRPSWAQPPTMPTADQIRTQAKNNVEQAHIRDRDDLEFRHKTGIENHVRQGLGLPVDNSAAAYEARRSAYMQRQQEQRQREKQNNVQRPR